MCTFKITNYPNNLEIDDWLKLGGPTLSTTMHIDEVKFTHNLLSVTGHVTPQPIFNNNKYFYLMGEVYNYDKILPSDIYHVVNLYNEFGDSFVDYLDGEYLIVIFDVTTSNINFFTDVWGTRQVWFERYDDYFYFGTFPRQEPIPSRFIRFKNHNELINNEVDFGKLIRLKNNSHYVFNLSTLTLNLKNDKLHCWDLTQYKTNYNDWTDAFINAVDKRYHPEAALFLSGGVDSVSIALALADLKKTFTSLNFNHDPEAEDQETYQQAVNYCTPYITPFVIDTYPSYSGIRTDRLTSVGLENYALVPLVDTASKLDKKVIYSGQGADDIITNYKQKQAIAGKDFDKWPTDLHSKFPYTHFYNGQNRRLIDRNEFICLTYGIEARCPFLDKRLAQEWLWINADLKNKEDKGPIKQFLRDRNIKLPEKTAGLIAQESWFKDKQKRFEHQMRMAL